jgi:bifunctional DNase/RNase
MKPSRPLTHDLFKNFAVTYNINIVEVIINKFEEGIFFAQLICEQNGVFTEIDSRTSDAIALALRFNCPIYTYQKILDDAAIGTDEDLVEEKSKDEVEHPEKINFEEYLLEELEEMLKKAVLEENYEDASRLRDEIKKRKTRNG